MTERLELDIVGDDSKYRPVAQRTNTSLDQLEKTATKAGAAIGRGLDVVTKGLLATLDRTEKLAAGTVRASDEIRASFNSVAKTFATYYAYLATATVGVYAHTQATIGLQNAYRLLRFAASPTIFTGIALAAGFAVEETLQLAYATGKLSQAQAFNSERTGNSIRELQELAAANKALNLSPGTLEGATKSLKKQFTGETTSKAAKAAFDELGLDKTKGYVDSLRDIAVAFDDIENPLEKARRAVQLFGDDAEKYLPILNSNLDDTIIKLDQMGVILGEQGAREFAEFGRDVDILKDKFVQLAKTIGFAVAYPISGLLAALKDPALKALLAQGGLAIGQTLLQASAAIAGAGLPFSPSSSISAEEREKRRRDAFSDQDFAKEVRGFLSKSGQAESRTALISSLEDKQKALSGYTTKTPEIQDRLAQITSQIALLKSQATGSTGLVNEILFGGKAPNLVNEYRNSLDGLNTRLGELKSQRTSLASSFETLNSDQKALAQGQLRTLNQDINATQAKIDLLDKQAEKTKEIEANEKRASQILLEAKKQELTGLGQIVQTYREYVALLGTSRKANLDLSEAVTIRLRAEVEKEQRKTAKDTIKSFQDDAAAELAYNTQRFQKGLQFEQQTEELRIRTLDEIFQYEQTTAAQSRDAQLQGLDGLNAQTLAQKLSVEARKFGIEQDYLNKVAILQVEHLDRMAKRDVQFLQTERDNNIITEKQFADRRDAILDESGKQALRIQQDSIAATDSARNSAATKSVQLVRDNTQRVFDSIKQSAGGVFDALLTKSQNIFQAIGNALKTAVLTAIKEVVTSQIAATFTKLLTGQQVSFEGRGSTGPLGQLGGIFGKLGLGGVPVFGGGQGGGFGPGVIVDNWGKANPLGGLATGGLIGTGKTGIFASGSSLGGLPKIEQPNHIGDVRLNGGAVPVYILNQAQQSENASNPSARIPTLGAVAGFAGLAGILAGGSGSAGSSRSAVASNISFGSGGVYNSIPTITGAGGGLVGSPGAEAAAGLGGMSSKTGILTGLAGYGKSATGLLTQLGNIGATNKLFQNGVYGAKGGAMLLGGGVLAADGLRRGGLVGLGETTAGGALIGAKFGGPIGALIGGAIGAAAGTIRLFIKGANEKAIQKVQDAYHLKIDKSLASQIVAISKQSYGGNLDMAIRSQSVRDLLQLYAMSTGQNFGVQAQMRSVSLSETSSGLQQNAIYENGRALSFGGIGVTGGIATTAIPGNANTSSATSATAGTPQTNYQTGTPNITVVVQSQLPAASVNDYMSGKIVQTVTENPRVVSKAAAVGTKANAGRRETQALYLAPGTLTA